MTQTRRHPAPDNDVTTAGTTVPTGLLLASAKDAARLAGRLPVPVLAGVRLRTVDGALEVARYDFEVALRRRVPADGTLPGTVVVNAAMLKTSLDRLDKRAPVALTLAEDRCVLAQGTRRIGLPLLDADDYPDLPETPATGTGPSFRITGDQLASLATSVTPFASTDDLLPVLNSVFVEAGDGVLVAAATDRFTAALAELPADTDTAAGAPVRALVPRMAYIGSVFAAADQVTGSVGSDRCLHLVSADTAVSVRLVDGDFPRLAGLFPHDPTMHTTFDPAAFAAALKFVEVGVARHRAVHLDCARERVKLSNNPNEDDAAVTDTVPATVTGPDADLGFQTAFRPGNLSRAIAVWGKSHPVTMHTTRSHTPAVFTSDAAPGLRVLVMPTRDDS